MLFSITFSPMQLVNYMEKNEYSTWDSHLIYLVVIFKILISVYFMSLYITTKYI